MKKTFLVPVIAVLASVFILASCMKNDVEPPCTGYSLDQDRDIIDSILDDQGAASDYTFDSEPTASLYYNIENAGTGNSPTLDSLVKLKFYARILGKTEIVDSLSSADTNTSFPLRNLPGLFTYGLLKLKEGGKINLILPSSRSYSCSQATSSLGKVIPPNSQLIYEMHLVEVNIP